MAIIHNLQEINKVVAEYQARYGTKILWEIILQKVKTFINNRQAILENPEAYIDWQGFLRYLAWIESTIGLYGYTKKGIFHRIFVMFGRAYLEEKEVCELTAATKTPLSWIFDESRYFKAGDGKKGDIDLQDANGVTYDVKNDSIDFKKAHTANFLLKYDSQSGCVELHQRPQLPNSGTYVTTLVEGRPLAEIAESLGLDPLLFNKHSTEEMIENYLGFIN
jgi:hypothetical protein